MNTFTLNCNSIPQDFLSIADCDRTCADLVDSYRRITLAANTSTSLGAKFKRMFLGK